MERVEKLFDISLPCDRAEREWRDYQRAVPMPAGAYDARMEPAGEDASRLSIIAADEGNALRRVERMVQDFHAFLGHPRRRVR
jgi:hypothetical protein